MQVDWNKIYESVQIFYNKTYTFLCIAHFWCNRQRGKINIYDYIHQIFGIIYYRFSDIYCVLYSFKKL